MFTVQQIFSDWSFKIPLPVKSDLYFFFILLIRKSKLFLSPFFRALLRPETIQPLPYVTKWIRRSASKRNAQKFLGGGKIMEIRNIVRFYFVVQFCMENSTYTTINILWLLAAVVVVLIWLFLLFFLFAILVSFCIFFFIILLFGELTFLVFGFFGCLVWKTNLFNFYCLSF